MMPSIDPREEARKKRMRVAVCITACAATASAAVSGSRFSGWAWVPWAVGILVISVVTTIAMAGTGSLPGGRGRGSGPSAISVRGREDDGRPVGAATHRWRVLLVVTRTMPRSAGRRWLAEAESLLAEIPAARRGTAIRSYLLSAPQLVLMMWAREVQRRARLGPRRPG